MNFPIISHTSFKNFNGDAISGDSQPQLKTTDSDIR